MWLSGHHHTTPSSLLTCLVAASTVGCLEERTSLSLCSASAKEVEGAAECTRPHDLPLKHMQSYSATLAHRRTLCSTWQTLTCRLSPCRAPQAACCFAMTTGSLSCPSWLLYWCAHICRHILPFRQVQDNIWGFLEFFLIFGNCLLVCGHEPNTFVIIDQMYLNPAEQWNKICFGTLCYN